MKIYSKVVWRWQPDGSLVKVPEECESFEYEGPLAFCGSNSNSGPQETIRDPLGLEQGQGVGGGILGKGQMPPQPDYIGAANAQSLGSIGTALANNLMSHPNISTPLGSQTWNQTGSHSLNIPGLGNIEIPQYSQTISLSPEQQSLYNKQTSLSGTLSDQAAANLGRPQDLNSAQAIADKAYSNYTSRLDPQWDNRQVQTETQLTNQGLRPGSEAWTNAMRDFNAARNDAYTSANTASINTMPQTYQLATAARDQPLNEMNALKRGSQVSMPQFQATQFPGQAQGPQTGAATQAASQWQQNMYNAQQAQRNANTSGLMGLGAAALSFL